MAGRRSRMRTVLPFDNSLLHSEDRFDLPPSYETLLESRNSLSNAKWMSVSKLYQMKPIAFRCSSDSKIDDEEFFWVSWKIKANEFGKICARRRSGLDRSDNFAPLTITRKEFSLGFPSDYTLPCLPTSAVKTRLNELESMRWSFFSFNGTSKICSRIGEQLAGENWDQG